MKRPVLSIALLLAASLPHLPSAQAQGSAVPSVRAPGPLKVGALPRGISRVTAVEGITEYRLANGLQVLLIPDGSKPTTTVNMTYRVGSRHESYGETGMAHLLEHLLFKGSPRHPQVWAEFNKRGLRANGSTWYDRTNYFASFAANDDNLRWYIGWQADAMINSFVARRDLDTEMTVVRNEMEMGENSPERILLEKTLATMYQWHNYGKSTIGARSDVENVDIPRLQAFYRQYYQPDNASLIVSGKFDEARVLKWIAESFGPIPRPKRTLPTLYTLDAVQDGERSVVLRRVGGVPLLYAGYHVPPAADPRAAAVEALSLILGEAPSGRLHKRLTEKQLAAAVFSFAPGLADPGFVIFGAQLAPDQQVDEARRALLGTLESLATEPVTAQELQRARTKWLKDWDTAFADPQTVGVALSEAIAQGDWRLYFLTRDRVRQLRLEDVQAVAQQFLVASNRTLAEYVPTAQPVRAPAPQRADVAAQFQDFRPDVAQAQAEVFDATPANIDRRTLRRDLPGGLKLALLPKTTRGAAVQATLVLRFGNEASLRNWGEAPAMLAALLDKGTVTLGREQIQDRLDELRTQLSISHAPGQLVVRLSSRREQLPQALRLLGEMLRRPALPAEVLEEVRRQALADLEQQRKDPEAVLGNALDRHGNPYPTGDVRHARSFDEIESDLRAVTLERVRDFHARFLGAAHGQFGAVGDMDPEAVRAALQDALGDWAGTEPYARVPDPLVERPAARLEFSIADKQNATLALRLAVPLSDRDPDYPALMLANHLFGSGGDSRLWNRIREREGLSYNVYSTVQWNPLDRHSTWYAEAIFAPSNRGKVEQAMREEIQRSLADGFTAQELEAGKRSLLNFRQLARAQDSRLAAGLAQNLYLQRDYAEAAKVDEALRKLTLDEVNAAWRRYLVADKLVWGAAGDFATQGQGAARP